MTVNQVAYWNLVESKRHNIATEGETNRHNLVTEDESERHNRESEVIGHKQANAALSQASTAAKNAKWQHEDRQKQMEIQSSRDYAQLSETIRHNQAMESTEVNKLGETARHNQAEETEKTRHNKADEDIRRTDTIWGNINDSINTALKLPQASQDWKATNPLGVNPLDVRNLTNVIKDITSVFTGK